MKNCIQIIRTTIFYLLIVISALFLALMAPVLNEDKFQRLLKSCCRLIIRGSFIKIKVNGINNIPKEEGYIIAANHSSFLDNIVLLGFFPAKFRFIADKSGFEMPIIKNIYAAAKFIKTSVKKNLEDSIILYKAIKSRANILIYSKPSRKAEDEIGQFTDSISKISKIANFPIVPVAIKGCSKTLPINSFIFSGNSVTMKIGEVLVAPSTGQITSKIQELYF